jgi:hypothetical protein
MTDDVWFERLGHEVDDVEERAPATLKSKVYSAVVERLAESGSLLDLSASEKAGGRLCVFERTLTLLPVGTDVRSTNPCRVCHARILGERMKRAPVFWPGCPYSEFHNS